MNSRLRNLRSCSKPALAFLLFFATSLPASAASPTVTTLAITSAGAPATSVDTLTAITLTATVTSSGTPVTPGQVYFCDEIQATCSFINHLATAQLRAAGTATYKFISGPGSHSYKAVFAGTNTYATSTSSNSTLTVNGPTHTVSVLSSSGTIGNYTLTATVSGLGAAAPSGTVSFLDQTESNTSLGSGTLAANPGGFVLSLAQLPFFTGLGSVTGDVNGDGIPDIITSYHYIYPDGNTCDLAYNPSEYSDFAIVYLGNGDGTYTYGADPNPFPVTCRANSLALADLNGDGFPDLIASPTTLSGVSTTNVLFGDGKGNFTTNASSNLSLQGTLLTADFTGDGIPDFAVVTGGSVRVYAGNSTGSIVESGGFYSSNITGIGQAAVDDFNNDGILDIAAVVNSQNTVPQTRYVQIFLGTGTGNFVAAPNSLSVSAAFNAQPILSADFNNDGNADIAVPLDDQGSLTIYLGDGTGNFTASATIAGPNAYPVGSDPTSSYGFTIGDFNNDGIPDIAAMPTVIQTVNGLTPASSIFLGDGTGAFSEQTASYLAVSNNALLSLPVSVTDLNGDGLPDFVDQLGNYLLLGNQSATATVTSVSPTPPATSFHQIVATYLGDSSYLTSTSQPVTINTVQGTPQVTLSASANPSGTGVPVTFTATVTGPGEPPLGTVNFLDGSTPLGSGTIANGTATFTTSTLSAGTHSITATFPGNILYLPASSAPLQFIVQTLPTPTISLLASASSSTYASAVTLTATVAGTHGTPSGTVNFVDSVSATSLGTATLNSSGVATLITSSLLPGAHDLVASYSGSTIYGPATSASVSLTVSKATPAITLSIPNIVRANSPFNFTVTITGPGTMPSGTVSIYSGATLLGQGALGSQGVALVSTTLSTIGPMTVTATYPGNQDYTSVTSSPQTFTVYGTTTPAISLAASATTASYGTSITFNTTLVGQQTTPSGSVQFFLGQSLLGTQPISSNGSATLSTSTLPVGSDTVTAYYAGDTNNASITSSPVTVIITQPSTITTTPANSTSYVGSSNLVTIALASTTGNPTPTGTVTLSGAGYTSAATALIHGSAAITIPANALPVGNDTLTASYSGDAVYSPSSSTFQITVTSIPPSFTLAGKTTSLTLAPGATTGNTDQITITPSEGFTGSATLTAALTSSPAGAVKPPTFSFGSTSPVTLDGKSAATATLTITTTAPSTTASAQPAALTLYAATGTALACLAFFGIPARKRNLRSLFALLFCLGLYASLTACGGNSHSGSGTGPNSSPGTTPGVYQITITGTSGSTTNTITIALTIQ